MGEINFNPNTGELTGTNNCVKCGKSLPQSAQFCSYCGEKQSDTLSISNKKSIYPSIEETLSWIKGKLESISAESKLMEVKQQYNHFKTYFNKDTFNISFLKSQVDLKTYFIIIFNEEYSGLWKDLSLGEIKIIKEHGFIKLEIKTFNSVKTIKHSTRITHTGIDDRGVPNHDEFLNMIKIPVDTMDNANRLVKAFKHLLSSLGARNEHF